MDDTNETLSPSGRRRKRTVTSFSQSDSHEPTEGTDDISKPIFSLAYSSSFEDDAFGKENNGPPKRRGKLSKISDGSNGDPTHDAESNVDQLPGHQGRDRSESSSSVISDVVYDETKPKRLSHSRPAKLDLEHSKNNSQHALHESINRLISPDDPEDTGSPKRRSRKQLASTKSAPNFTTASANHEVSAPAPTESDQVSRKRLKSSPEHTTAHESKSDPLPDNKTVENIKVPNYKHSPETRRRKISSPVQRLIVKNSPLAAAAAASSKDRKASDGARLGISYDKPRRKISSDARLEHRYIEEQLKLPTNSGPKRKVSFDTTALINGRKVMPLNDEYIMREEQEQIEERNISSDNSFGRGKTNQNPLKLNIPKVTLTTPEEDEELEKIENVPDEDLEEIEKVHVHNSNSNDNSEASEEGYASGCDNAAYVHDEETEVTGDGSEYEEEDDDVEYITDNQKSNRDETVDENEDQRQTRRYFQPLDPPEYDEPAVIQHSAEYSNRLKAKKISASSLPDNFGRRMSNGSDLSQPKSILKVRKDDVDSLASQDSLAVKSFKVRKDSIALFMDQHGELAIEELRQEYSNKFRCFRKSAIKQLWIDRKMILEKYKLHFIVLGLFLLTFAFVVVGLHYHNAHYDMLESSQKVFFEPRDRELTLGDIRNNDNLRGNLGFDIPSWKMPVHCYTNYESIVDKACYKWREHGQLDIVYINENSTQCYNITWNLLPETSVYDCYNIGDGNWYGPLNTTTSQWPIRLKEFTFNVNNTKHHGSGTFSYAVEYYWLSSRGEAVIVDSQYPLEISWNVRKRSAFCLIWKPSGDTLSKAAKTTVNRLSYAVCNGIDIQRTHAMIRKKFYPAVSRLPDRRFMGYPHWSTVSDSDHFNLNDTTVESVADKIRKHRLNCSSIEIDGKWEKKFGDLVFDENDFDNMTELLTAVSNADCTMSLSVYPYFDFHSTNFNEGMTKEYFVEDPGGSVPALLKWEHGVGAMLDVSNPGAREWFTTKLRNIASRFAINTFRLEYGSSSWIPSSPMFHLENMSPSKIKLMFSDLLNSLGSVVVESTSQSQHLSTLIGISSSVVNDGQRNCLKNIIPDVLNLGLIGYPFVMSDGFDITHRHSGMNEFVQPSRDLYIRWMQLSTFFPAIRYTVKPWNYDAKVIEASRNLTNFHRSSVLTAIFQSEKAILKGAPIIQPMWWNRSKDKDTFLIDDQFVVADMYLVAPILCESHADSDAAERDIYVPEGVWKDVTLDKVILGPKWLRKYKATQFHIPLFERMPEYKD